MILIVHTIKRLLKRPLVLLVLFIAFCEVSVFYYSHFIRSYRHYHDDNEHKSMHKNKIQERKSLLEQAEKVSNIAGKFYEEYSSRNFTFHIRHENVDYCDKVELTDPAFLHYNNEIFQVYTWNHTYFLYLYSAFYDNRFPIHKVRIVLSTNHQPIVQKMRWKCVLWYEESRDPIMTDGFTNPLWPIHWKFGSRDGIFGPELLTCNVPETFQDFVPRAVSVQFVNHCWQVPRTPTNILRIEAETRRTETQNRRLSIGVCSKGFRYGDKDEGIRMIEWLEMIKLMEADKVYLYTYGLAGKMKKILDHYQDEGFVEWRRLNFPGEQLNINILYNYFYQHGGPELWPQESMELNDCLYRNMAKHDYIAIIDMDEMIVPVKDQTWPELLERIQKKSKTDKKYFDYVINRNTYLLEDMVEDEFVDKNGKESIPEYLFMMKHTQRTGFRSYRKSAKSFSSTKTLMAVHNHRARKCWNAGREFVGCSMHIADPNTTSRMFHFRHGEKHKPNARCLKSNPDTCVYQDRTLWRYYRDLKRLVEDKIRIFYEEYEDL